MEHYLGVDIGGTKTAVVVAAVTGDNTVEFLGRREIPTAEIAGPDAAVRQIVEFAHELCEKSGVALGSIGGVGVSCGGPLDSRSGMILSPPNLPGWDEVPIVSKLGSALSLPVRLMNDADAGAIAEQLYGAGRGARNMIFVTFGTGFGAGLILDGRLYEGSSNAAGEIGHVRLESWGSIGYGKRGSVEGFCSGGGIAQTAVTLVTERLQRGEPAGALERDVSAGTVSARSVFTAAAAGDEIARDVVEVTSRQLGRALAILVDLLNPEIIVLGGIFARAEQQIRPVMEQSLAAEAIAGSLATCRVVPAELGERIGDYAAICAAMEIRT
ncbi:MAG: ROK family protein [Spirochaetaceae bacterium]|nr:MAG: ROK family protein [Spirochaetaceae bacterium]